MDSSQQDLRSPCGPKYIHDSDYQQRADATSFEPPPVSQEPSDHIPLVVSFALPSAEARLRGMLGVVRFPA